MQYLIRDAAHPMHAVMGIASLENCAVQITCRDDYIGWNQKAFIERIVTVDNDRAKEEFKQLLVYLEDGIDGIDYSELCTAMVVKNPTDTDIQLLLDEASNAEQNRQQLLRNEVEGDVDDIEKSELGSISIDAERALYRRKRAEQLARLLSAKKAIRDLINAENFNEIWIDFCKSETGNSAIRGALVAQKTKHIGSSMMELNVCGAIPPYNEILGGKLVALLATSPQVIHDYKERYADKASEIASRLKGMPVCRPADLVYVGTTSLYYVGSSQYNRLKMPGSIFNTDFDIVWKKLIKEVIFEESERRGRLLAEARVANIVEYNKKVAEKLAPIVVVIDEFADLADQLETTKEKNAFYKPVQRIAQAGRSRGIHLVICTQRPEAKLVPSTTKAQLNGRVALRVNDGISSRMIIEEPDAQYLQKHGDMIYRNGDIIERAQGYLIEIEELDKIVDDVIHGRI